MLGLNGVYFDIQGIEIPFDGMTKDLAKRKDLYQLTSFLNDTVLLSVTVCYAIIVALIVLVLIVLFSFWCHDVFYKGHQPNKNNRALLQFVLSDLICILIFVVTISCAVTFLRLATFSVSEEKVAQMLSQSMEPESYKNYRVKKSWDKLQIQYECCGVNNYTDWNKVPDSCNKLYAVNCGNSSSEIDNINQAGCKDHFASRINHQVKFAYFRLRITCVLCGVWGLYSLSCGQFILSVIQRRIESYIVFNKDKNKSPPDTNVKIFEEPRENGGGDDNDDISKENEKEKSESLHSLMTVYHSMSGDEDCEDV